MKRKINLRLAFIAVVAIVFTALATTVIFYNLFQTQVREDLKTNAHLLMETEMFQDVYRQAGGSDTSAISDQMAQFDSGRVRITWIAPDGTVLFDNDVSASGLPNHLDRPEIQKALKTGEGESIRRSDTMNLNTYYYALRMEDGTVLRLSTQARTISSVFLTALPVILIIAAVILVFCILLGHFLTRQLIRPIEQMAENLDDPACSPAYKELQPFADKIRSQHENVLAAAKSRQDFTANVTHELKTPITAISGYAELIENKMVSGDEEVHVARQIRENADRLTNLVSDIIRLSELDHKELPHKFEQMDLYQAAKDCCDNLMPLAEKKSVKLTCQGTYAGINGEKSMIQEMIENLVQNAIRYNKKNGSVMVTVTIEDRHPILIVEDTGIGIPKDQQERVFERFYRVDKSRSRATGGTGLGLAIVKHIADIHSAEISLESTLGVGTKITVTF